MFESVCPQYDFVYVCACAYISGLRDLHSVCCLLSSAVKQVDANIAQRGENMMHNLHIEVMADEETAGECYKSINRKFTREIQG